MKRDQSDTVVIGTRRSQLAQWQTQHVADRLRQRQPDRQFAIHEMNTQGDRQLEVALPEIGGKGLFTEELNDAIRSGTIDLAIHSLKDLPVGDESGVVTVAVLERADPRDVLVDSSHRSLSQLPRGAVIGTSSPRRVSQILALRDDVTLVSVRGNVPTRIEKTRTGSIDAVVLAAAGVSRLDLQKHISHVFTPDQILPAPGQGALAATCRANDTEMRAALQQLVDQSCWLCTAAERTLLELLGGGCAAPIAALATIDNDQIMMTGRVASLDGQHVITSSAVQALPASTTAVRQLLADQHNDCATAPPESMAAAANLAAVVAADLRSQGADQILASSRPSSTDP